VLNKKLSIQLTSLLVALALFITPTEALAVPIQSLNGQTGQTQTFQNDSNVAISSSNNIHSLGWLGLLPLSRGGTGAGSFALGSLLFSNGTAIAEDNSNLFWDNTNKRLGIGTSTPTSSLDVNGDATINSITVGLGGGSVAGNTSVGNLALYSNSSGSGNTAIGFETLTSQVSGENNTAVGASAMKENVTGENNVAVGTAAIRLNSSGSSNVALGGLALHSNSSGNNNIAIGGHSAQYQATDFNELASPENSIYIGAYARGYDNNDINSIVLGYNTIGAGANKTVIGNSDMTDVYFGSANGNANTHARTIYSGSSTVPGCIVMGDTAGGVGYITLNSGVLTVSSTPPSACQ